jgi:hypothetical protein
VGAAVGLVHLAVIGSGVYLVVTRDGGEPSVVAATSAEAGAPTAVLAPPAPVTLAPPTSTILPAPPSPRPNPAPSTKDAGGPRVADAGSSKPVPPNTEDDLAARKRIAESRCANFRGILSRNNASTNDGAKQVKTLTCLPAQSLSPNAGSSNCERSACRTACAMLQDKACLQNLDFAEKNNPLPF